MSATAKSRWSRRCPTSQSSGATVTPRRTRERRLRSRSATAPASWKIFPLEGASRAVCSYSGEGTLARPNRWFCFLMLGLLQAAFAQQEIWTFDRLDLIGGRRPSVLGHPKVIDTRLGKAVEFDGVGDALIFDVHPLAGASAYTWEAIFRPDGGNSEQRWFHLEEKPGTGENSNHRMLFEIRVVDGKWCLDAFNHSATGEKALLDRSHLHELGQWCHVAAVYDGAEFRSYVDGVLDGAARVRLAPQKEGRTAVGMRL